MLQSRRVGMFGMCCVQTAFVLASVLFSVAGLSGSALGAAPQISHLHPDFELSSPSPYVGGLHRLEDGSKIYVNRGTGFWGPPIRLFAPPEITVVHVGPVKGG